MKKTIAFLLSVVLMLSAGAASAAAINADTTPGADVTDNLDTTPDADATDALDTMPDADVTDAPAVQAGMANFQKVNTYSSGQFEDVTPANWYSADVATVYELGLMGGESGSYFNAGGPVTMVQAIVMAARLHSIYNTGSCEFGAGDPWYEPYVNYAREHGIIIGNTSIYGLASRAQFADILSRALPAGDLEQINEIAANAIPDVKTGDLYAEGIYMLYRAGIVSGSNFRKAFFPKSGISRAEAAAILARMADKSHRKSFTVEYSGPDLTALEAKDDSFFANSAILGNSLVEGLRLYSNLKSLHYFSATSVSVVSATRTRNVRLQNGSNGTLVQALCQKQYDKIYIELGINEIGGNLNTFITNYGNMIDTIRAAEPNADIYILSILPVTRSKSQSSTSFNMTRVNAYNAALYKLAGEKQCYYMNVCSAFQGSDGYLPASWSWDGVHLQAKYYSVWENCIRTLY